MRETTAAAIGLFMFVCVAASGGYLVSAGLIRTNGQGFGAGGDSAFWNPKVDGNEGYEHNDDDNDDYEDEHHSPGHHHNFHHNHHHGFHRNHDDHFHNFHHDHHDHHRSGHHHDQWRNHEDGYHHRELETGKIPHFHNHDHHDQNYHNHHNYHHHHSFHNEHQPIAPEHQGKGFPPYDEVHEDQTDDIQPKQTIDNNKCEVPSVVAVGAIAEEENQKQTPNLVLDLVDSNSTLVQVIEDTSTMIIDSDNSADSETPATVVTEKAADSSFSSADNDSAPKSETTTCVSLEEKTVTSTISDYIEPGSGDATSNSQSEETSADPTDTPRRGPLNEAGLPAAIDIRIDQGGSDFDSVN